YVGVVLGKKFGMVFANKSSILGGVILILIGIEIFVTGIGLL
ncbi:MAG: manganese efflux pump, partial [Solobacterium sp.]|nr:manganese efflux pump [Solobacterium sp.]